MDLAGTLHGAPSRERSPAPAGILIVGTMEANGVPGQVGRYRVEREIGSGGMGTVYLGWDELLERRVAIKALHPHRAMDEEARRRFLREARSLSRLAHPGICTIHDILEHEGTQYLILEYVEGVPLRQAIQENDLPWEERLAIAETLLEAVAAAHEAGLVHRDLKPANVMLRAGGGVAVLDFGLARTQGVAPARPAAPATGGAPSDGSLTEDAVVVGTPGYIPPEQADGQPSGPAGDVYTLGLVLQELLTGEPAFDPTVPWYQLLAAARAGDRRPVNLRHAALRQLIEQMSSVNPADRPTAGEALRRLRQIRREPERRRRRRLLAAAVGTAAVLSLLAGIGVRHWLLPPPLLTPDEHARIAVFPFGEPTGRRSLEMGTGIAEMLSQTLASHPRLDAVPVREVIQAAGSTPGPDPERMARVLGVRILVSGTMDVHDQGLLLNLRVLDLHGGLQSFRVRATTLPELLALTSSELVRRIAPGQTTIDPRERFSPDPLAALAYASGESRRLNGGARAALPYFEVCLDRDPGFHRALLGKVTCLEALGRWKEGLALASQALESVRKAPDVALEIEALQAAGTIQLRLGHLDAAKASWERAIQLARKEGRIAEETNLESDLGVLEQKRGNVEQATRRYRRAAHLALGQGDRYRLANAELNLGSIARARGHLGAARHHFERALAIYRRLDRLEDTGLALYNLGAVAWIAGDLDQAERRFQEAHELQRRAGNPRLAAEALEGLAALAWTRGRPETAAATIGEALEVYRKLGHQEGVARASGNLATILRDQGRWPEAITTARECLTTSTKLGLHGSESICRVILAQTLALDGRPREARRVLASGNPVPASAGALAAQALILYRLGDFSGAAGLMQRALQQAQAPDRPQMEGWLETMRRAARDGRMVPLRPDTATR